MEFQNLRYERDAQGIVTIRFARPDQRNAMTAEMGAELIAAGQKAASDPEARVVVLTGEGKAFSAGGDMKMIHENTRKSIAENEKSMRDFYGRFLKIRDIPVPTIAQINGAAVGAGLCVALACDIRLASTEAKLAANFTALGLHPGMGGTWLLPRSVGLPQAAELLFSSRWVDGKEAERIGLVNRACAPEELDQKTRELAAQIAGCAPLAVRLTKESLSRSSTSDLFEQLDFEARQQARTFASEDAREGLAAAGEKRPPKFRGK